jgi:hypothetical protein
MSKASFVSLGRFWRTGRSCAAWLSSVGSGFLRRLRKDNARAWTKSRGFFAGSFTHVSIARTREEAFRNIAEPSLWVNDIYTTRRNLDGSWPPALARISMEQFGSRLERGRTGRLSSPIAGTVGDAIERLLPAVQGRMGLTTQIGIEARPPGTRTEDAHRTMTLFAQEVMPVLKIEAAKPSSMG